MDLIREYWWLGLIAIVLAFAAILLLRPRQKVQLTDSAPVRPHMAHLNREGQGLADEAAAADSNVTGEILEAPVHRNLPGASQSGDDLSQLKGVGPRFADALNAAGFHRFEQLAGLSQAEVERLDAQLGAFRGRLVRDRVVEQADYLSRNDVDGYEQKFGKL